MSDAMTLKQLQDSRVLLRVCAELGIATIAEAETWLDREISTRVGSIPDKPSAAKEERISPNPRRCPSCGRAIMRTPKGVAEPVLICPACRYSVYGGAYDNC